MHLLLNNFSWSCKSLFSFFKMNYIFMFVNQPPGNAICLSKMSLLPYIFRHCHGRVRNVWFQRGLFILLLSLHFAIIWPLIAAKNGLFETSSSYDDFKYSRNNASLLQLLWPLRSGRLLWWGTNGALGKILLYHQSGCRRPLLRLSVLYVYGLH